MASPFTEMEWYTIVFSLAVFSLFTLQGLIQERCVHTTVNISKKDLRNHSSSESTCMPLKTEFMEHGLSRIRHDDCCAHNLACMLLPLLRVKPHRLLLDPAANSGFELVFIIIAFTIMCLFGLAAVYTHNTEYQDDYIQTEQKITQQKNNSKDKRVVTKTNQEIP